VDSSHACKASHSNGSCARVRSASPFRGKLRALKRDLPDICAVAIAGAGAAGLATAIFTRRLNPSRSVVLLDGAKKPGAKILISGGSRCNVTNVAVADADFWGGRRSIIRRILRAFPPQATVTFFNEIGVTLHEEAGGKLFPDSNRARDVLDALLRELRVTGVTLLADHRVLDIVPSASGFRIVTSQGDLTAARLVLATGGRSLPKSGSDGTGLEIARGLGHTIVPTTPALTPFLLADDDEIHRALSGVAQDVELSMWIDGIVTERLSGAMLWTHFGASGPVALNMSRHWLRADLAGRQATITVNFCGASFDEVDRRWTELARAQPRAPTGHTLATMMPASAAGALLRALAIDGTITLAHLSRDARRRLAHALTSWPLPVVGARGYNHAEVTAGGVALTEIEPATMESRICPGLFLVGEMLDVDGRIGGFNFQWAWATGRVAGAWLAR
jgi:predicted Rossmann fold flavoprotein